MSNFRQVQKPSQFLETIHSMPQISATSEKRKYFGDKYCPRIVIPDISRLRPLCPSENSPNDFAYLFHSKVSLYSPTGYKNKPSIISPKISVWLSAKVFSYLLLVFQGYVSSISSKWHTSNKEGITMH